MVHIIRMCTWSIPTLFSSSSISFVFLSHTTQNGRFGFFGSQLRCWNNNSFSFYFLRRERKKKKTIIFTMVEKPLKRVRHLLNFRFLCTAYSLCVCVCVRRFNEFRFRFAHTAFISKPKVERRVNGANKQNTLEVGSLEENMWSDSVGRSF